MSFICTLNLFSGSFPNFIETNSRQQHCPWGRVQYAHWNLPTNALLRVPCSRMDVSTLSLKTALQKMKKQQPHLNLINSRSDTSDFQPDPFHRHAFLTSCLRTLHVWAPSPQCWLTEYTTEYIFTFGFQSLRPPPQTSDPDGEAAKCGYNAPSPHLEGGQ